jgi:hypothetical protein
LRAQQTVTVTNSAHTISLYSEKGIHLTVTQNSTNIIDTDIIDDYHYTFTPAAGNLTIILKDHSNGSFDIGHIQLEKNPFNTSYTSSTRGDSILTVPLKFTSTSGSIFFWFSPQSQIVSSDSILFEYGDMRLEYNNLGVYVEKSSNLMNVAVGITEGVWYSVLLSWKGSYAKLQVDGMYAESNSFSINPGNHFCVGFSETVQDYRSNSLIDNLYVIDRYEDNIDKFQGNLIQTPLIHMTFDGSVSNNDYTVIELQPANKNMAPVIVQKEDGTVLRRIAFTDPESGEYMTYAAETFKCTGSNIFQVPFNDIATDIFKPFAEDQTGNRIEVQNVTGDKITLDIDGKEKYGQKFTIYYQPRDIYTVEYTDDDMFRVKLGKHDGQPVTITYETEDKNDVKLLTNIDLNAMNNPNHDGFIYLTKDLYNIENMDYSIYPRELKANAMNKALIVIDAKDKYGNIISDATFSLEATYGNINMPPAGQIMEVPLQQQAGRYIYEYTSPLINASFDGYIYDSITIKAFQNNTIQMTMQANIKLLSV